LRRTPALRELVAETTLSPGQLIYPLFIEDGLSGRREIPAMPGVERVGLDELAAEAEIAQALGLGGLLLFGIPEQKDLKATGAYSERGIVQRAIAELKRSAPALLVMADVCLCEYTSHGHCGVIDAGGLVDNDASLPLIAKTAASLAAAGADIVAPSDMMDGRVAAIRATLDSAGLQQTPIASYAVKYSSAFYGPFRDAAGSAPAFGARRGGCAAKSVNDTAE